MELIPNTSEDVAVFYSAIHDSIVLATTDLAGPNSLYSTAGIFSWLRNTNSATTSTLLFDAANLSFHNFEIYPVSNGFSDSLMLFRNGNIYTVYDASNQTTTTFDLGQTPVANINGGNIILVSTLNYSKFYAFQKGTTEWVELIPEGNQLYYSATTNTAVVARFAKVYAFAPGINTGTDDEIVKRPASTLDQNYPNPFYPSTSISFSIPSQSFVSLKISNAVGTEVATLVSEKLPAGKYSFNWYASGLPAGIYFYHLQTENHSLTRKMVLVK